MGARVFTVEVTIYREAKRENRINHIIMDKSWRHQNEFIFNLLNIYRYRWIYIRICIGRYIYTGFYILTLLFSADGN